MNFELSDLDFIINELQNYEKIKDFKYNKEFFRIWKKKIYSIYNSSQAFLSDQNDESQIFHYEYSVCGKPIEFCFNIEYLLSLLSLDRTNKKLFIDVAINNENGKLRFQDWNCTYTHYSKEDVESKYDNLDDVLIAPIPLINTHEYTVIDGNHRVCNQIHLSII